jgi:plastocyanin domain-containing protein
MNKSTTISIIIALLIIGGTMFFASQKNSNSTASTGNENGQAEKNITIDNQGNSTTTVSDNINAAKTITVSNNVDIVNGVQIVNLTARGGYSPRQTIAKAGIPTTIRFITNGTFDCSLSVRIASLGLSQYLTQNGITDIKIGTPALGLFTGTCGMGMYYFGIDFQ